MTKACDVLVVDDYDGMRVTLCDLLSDEGLLVEEAGSGRECLATIQKIRPRVILLDMAMADLDGTDVLDVMRETPSLSAIHVVRMSGSSRWRYVELPKPFSIEELFRALAPFVPGIGAA